MKAKTLNTLEYNKIIDMLTQQANSSMAKETLKKMKPMTNIGDIKDALAETTEFPGSSHEKITREVYVK